MKKIITILLLVSALLCICACDDGEATSSATESSAVESSEAVSSEAVSSEAVSSEASSQPAAAAFAVKVVDNEGNPVANAIVQICKDSCIPSKTNEEGIATFNVEVTAEHKLSFTSLPAGYTYEGEAEVYLSDGMDEYTLTVTKSN